MVHNRPGLGAFEFVVLSSLRVTQLVRGCTPRVHSTHKHVTTAQLEVAAGMVVGLPVVTVLPAKGSGPAGTL